MGSQLFDLPAVIPSSVVASVVAVLIVAAILSRQSKLDAIPTVGSSSWVGSWWAGLKYLIHAPEIIQEGYEKNKLAPFKVAEHHRWLVIVSNPEHVEEMQRAPIDTLSFTEAFNDQIRIEDTMGPKVYRNPYHVQIVRSQLNQNLYALYPEVRDEIVTALDDVLDLRGNEWKSMPALYSMQKVVCRASNRVFVGLPLCRDPDWIDLNIRYTIDIAKESAILTVFPKVLKPIAGRLFTNVRKTTQRGKKLIGPMIEERQRYLSEYGNEWADKPNDFLSWLMDEAQGPESSVESLTTRILVVNFLSIHTSASSFTHALLHLAANSEYIQPLREEVEDIVKKEGWSKVSLSKMRKVDSFLRECQRIYSINCVTVSRKALKDFTFSDGTVVPKGTLMVVPARSVHLDEALYENAHAFEPFRFADLHEEGDGVKHQFVSTSTKYLPFGHGRLACPGRFFAAIELKTMLAYTLMTYDVKLEEEVARPQPLRFVTALLPDPRAKLMFRKRVD